MKIIILLLITFVNLNINFCYADKCGYKGCHPTVPGKLNAHLVAHTHDDVGWLKTVDQYYYGSNKVHSPFGVQYILDSVISELLKKNDRRFVYVESSFLWRWWQEQDEEIKKKVRELVIEGKLQLLHGGWCMSDEATPHYSALIDQMTLGLKFLNETFGECSLPRVAWQIDPFGHSSEVALQFAQMGYDGLFFGRLDYEDYHRRKYMKTMEMIWRPDPSIGPDGDLFTGVLYNLYMPPDGFCFDTYCSDEPIMDNPKLHGYNVKDRVSQFVKAIRLWSESYKSPHVMITMGGDFNYLVASSWFKNMDKLIKYINQKYNDINVLYSTPACYLEALHAENITWPVKDNDDFFPYGSDDHSYWTGYFTSRPNLKYFVYKGNNLLQVCKQLRVALGSNILEDEELVLSRAMADAQHHDAVSGTEKQHVADDYASYLYEGFENCKKILTAAYTKWAGTEVPEQKFCLWTNISTCAESELSSKFVISVYNPLAQPVSTYLRVPVLGGSYKVVNFTGAEIPYELVPVSRSVSSTPGRRSNATYELLIKANNLTYLGLTTYYVEKLNGNGNTESIIDFNKTLNTSEELSIQNGVLKLIFNKTTGLLETVMKENETWPFKQNFYFYEASKGYNYNSDNRASGAYIFRPARNFTHTITENVSVSIYKGKDVEEVHQVFDTWLSQVIRLYKGVNQIEFQWLVGPIPVEKWMGKEVITRYSTDLQTNGVFWTDSNGRRMIKRIRNYRSSWNLTLSEPVASNYYPVTTTASIVEDNYRKVTVSVDRPQGATSLNDGELEFMLHRRLLYDDNKGVTEPLDEIQFGEGLVARGTHVIEFGAVTNLKNHRLTSRSIISSPWVSFSKTKVSYKDWFSVYKNIQDERILKNPLPDEIHLLTLQWWTENSILLRLEHIFEDGVNVNVNLKELLKNYIVNDVVELTLAASKELSNLSRLQWKHEGSMDKNQTSINLLNELPQNEFKNPTEFTITLEPMQIRTFRLYVSQQKT
ncbi:lysosomal alpha-mannosidase-like [Lycorma delicatula]|uniref:lysosomal alpha-mannosidase-like n=1 Tax=Lycorma delicatula TaxID=130591 RepID=UPI003F517D91